MATGAGFPKARHVIVALTVVALSLSISAIAVAQEGTVIVRDGEAQVAVVYAPEGITRGPGATPQPVDWPYICFWFNGAFPEEVDVISNPVPGRWYSLTCNPRPGSGRDFIFVITQYDPAEPIPGEPDLVSAHEVREFAEDFAAPPPLPIAISPAAEQITGVETWLWPDGPLDTVSASASAGGLTVVVEARYQGTTYDLGDGSAPLFCPSATAWVPGATTSDCTHTFLSEASGHRITATSTWDFYWFDNAAQPVPVLYETFLAPQVLDVDIIDLEAVISRSGE